MLKFSHKYFIFYKILGKYFKRKKSKPVERNKFYDTEIIYEIDTNITYGFWQFLINKFHLLDRILIKQILKRKKILFLFQFIRETCAYGHNAHIGLIRRLNLLGIK